MNTHGKVKDLLQIRSDEMQGARSEISSMLESVSEDVVIGTTEVVNVRSRRVPEESRKKVKKWIMNKGDKDRKSMCFHG